MCGGFGHCTVTIIFSCVKMSACIAFPFGFQTRQKKILFAGLVIYTITFDQGREDYTVIKKQRTFPREYGPYKPTSHVRSGVAV